MQSNGISWNPQEAMIFTVANEDNNLYSFDLRNVSHRRCNMLHVSLYMLIM